jgi:membrane-associated phospholipid phosphatase
MSELAGRIRDDFERVDRALFDALAREHDPVLDRVMPGLSKAADYGVLWICIAITLAGSGRPHLRQAALRGIVSLAIASATANGIAKLSFQRRRPSLDGVPVVRRVRRKPVTTSFPSGHAASAAAFTFGAGRVAPELRVPLGMLAAGVCFSRVWTGAHYPADVAVGAGLGTAVAYALRWPKSWGS